MHLLQLIMYNVNGAMNHSNPLIKKNQKLARPMRLHQLFAIIGWHFVSMTFTFSAPRKIAVQSVTKAIGNSAMVRPSAGDGCHRRVADVSSIEH
jgi:hypothetical protein